MFDRVAMAVEGENEEAADQLPLVDLLSLYIAAMIGALISATFKR